MRISRAVGIMLAIGAIAILCVSLAYALTPYFGYTYSEGNTTGASGMSVDIYVDKGAGYVPLDGSMVFPEYNAHSGAAVPIDGEYKLYLKQNGSDATGDVRLWCKMSNDASWALIEGMYIIFDGMVNQQGDPIKYYFGAPDNNHINSGHSTQAIHLTGEVGFTIYIQFRDIGYTVDDNGADITSFTGSKFVFAFGDADPFQSS